MADSLSAASANLVLTAILQAVPYAEPAMWMKLHIGAPGPYGVDGAAYNVTRQDITAAFITNVAGGGSITNDAVIEWVGVPAAETYTHFSVWSAATFGSFIFSGTVTGGTVVTGNNFQLPVSAVTVSLIPAT